MTASLWQRFLATIVTTTLLLRFLAIIAAATLWQRFLVIAFLWQRLLVIAIILWLKWNVIIIGMTVGTTTAGIIVIGTRVNLVTLLVASVL